MDSTPILPPLSDMTPISVSSSSLPLSPISTISPLSPISTSSTPSTPSSPLSPISPSSPLSPSMSLSSLSTYRSASQNGFTMIFMDVDDTLIPTTIRQTLLSNLGIDIFDLLSTSPELIKLQHSVIKSIKKLKKLFSSNNQIVKICLVSSASTRWLNYIFDGNIKKNRAPILSVLGSYLKEHNIGIISAPKETRCFLKKKLGQNGKKIIAQAMNQDDSTRWIWKYTTFFSVINQIKKELNIKCKRIISFGDGRDEYNALNHYASIHDVESLHFSFIPAPTIYQLRKQWKYIKDNLYKFVIKTDDKNLIINNNFCGLCYDMNGQKINENLYLHDLCNIFPTDNNKQCIGQMVQLPEIGVYFQKWMNKLTQSNCQPKPARKHKKRSYSIKDLCKIVHCKMYTSRPLSASKKTLQIMVSYLLDGNSKFYQQFAAYCDQVSKHKNRSSTANTGTGEKVKNNNSHKGLSFRLRR